MSDSDQDDSQKTEEATPKRLQDARNRGQVALSREVNNFSMIFAGAMIVLILGPHIIYEIKIILTSFLSKAHDIPMDQNGLGKVIKSALKEISLVLFLPFLLLFLAGILGPFIQIGALFSTESVKPSLEKISILKGAKRLFSTTAVVEFLKAVLKLSILSAVGIMLLLPFYASVDHFIGLDIIFALHDLHAMAFRLFIGILSVLAVIAAIDYMYQRHEHMKKLKMSKHDIKEEFKQMEGDPHVKARLRELRAEKARQRMMASVPDADVVITNPTHFANALKYDPDNMNAPVMVAKGTDKVAERIKDLAKEHNIPIVENPPLARALYDTMEIDDMIPEEHYKAVAEVISYIFRLKNKTIN